MDSELCFDSDFFSPEEVAGLDELDELGVLDELDAPDDSGDGLRLSVIYQPDPLKMIPVGEKILRTPSDAQFGHWRIGASCTD